MTDFKNKLGENPFENVLKITFILDTYKNNVHEN